MANIIGYGDQMVKLEAYGDQLVGPVPLSSSSGDLESIYNALVAKGITPASESLSDILTAINTIVVPSGTYTYPSGSTGGNVDVTNYAQVNASNVYAKGKADGDVKHTVQVRIGSSNRAYSTAGVQVLVDGVQKLSYTYGDGGGIHDWGGYNSITV